jgi:hypothetical protein
MVLELSSVIFAQSASIARDVDDGSDCSAGAGVDQIAHRFNAVMGIEESRDCESPVWHGRDSQLSIQLQSDVCRINSGPSDTSSSRSSDERLLGYADHRTIPSSAFASRRARQVRAVERRPSHWRNRATASA